MMVEGVEELRQLKYMLGQVRRLRSGDALINDVRSLRRREPQFSDFVGLVEESCCVARVEITRNF
jgi:hypothetical protein